MIKFRFKQRAIRGLCALGSIFKEQYLCDRADFSVLRSTTPLTLSWLPFTFQVVTVGDFALYIFFCIDTRRKPDAVV